MDYLKGQWKTLRDKFRRCIVNRKTQSRSGSKSGKLSKCKYFENLQFLSDVISNAETESNVTIPNNQAKSNNQTVANNQSIPSNQLNESIVGKAASTPNELSTPVIKMPYRKRKKDSSYAEKVDLILVDTLKKMQKPRNFDQPLSNEKEKEKDTKTDSETLFCQSLVDQLKALNARKNKLARIKIQQILFEI